MRKLIILIAALFVAVPGTALAAKAKTKTIKSTGTAMGAYTSPPNDGAFQFSASAKDSKLGAGALVADGTLGTTTGGEATGTATLFSDLGAMKGSFAFAVKSTDDPNVLSIAGPLKITSGTGKYKRAKGTVDVMGEQHLDTGYFTFKYELAAKYKK